jgi:hypothetical protein
LNDSIRRVWDGWPVIRVRRERRILA